MDFNFSEEQEAIRTLADEVFTSKAGIDRVKQVELSDERIDRDLWRELVTTGLLGIALPEEYGGGGLGLAELYVLLEQQGRHVAPVPIWQTALAASQSSSSAPIPSALRSSPVSPTAALS